jgi:hypothetical protein
LAKLQMRSRIAHNGRSYGLMRISCCCNWRTAHGRDPSWSIFERKRQRELPRMRTHRNAGSGIRRAAGQGRRSRVGRICCSRSAVDGTRARAAISVVDIGQWRRCAVAARHPAIRVAVVTGGATCKTTEREETAQRENCAFFFP